MKGPILYGFWNIIEVIIVALKCQAVWCSALKYVTTKSNFFTSRVLDTNLSTHATVSCFPLHSIFRISRSVWIVHDDVIKWKHLPRYWPFVRGIHRSPVNSPHKGQWRGALMFCLICARINAWVNNGETGDMRRHRAHYDVIVINDNYYTKAHTIINSAHITDCQHIIKMIQVRFWIHFGYDSHCWPVSPFTNMV